MVKTVLGKVAHVRFTRHDDIAGIRGFESGHDTKQGRLAGAVGTGESDAVTFGDMPSNILENTLAHIGFG